MSYERYLHFSCPLKFPVNCLSLLSPNFYSGRLYIITCFHKCASSYSSHLFFTQQWRTSLRRCNWGSRMQGIFSGQTAQTSSWDCECSGKDMISRWRPTRENCQLCPVGAHDQARNAAGWTWTWLELDSGSRTEQAPIYFIRFWYCFVFCVALMRSPQAGQ